jgi:hypothetical protein
MKAYRAGRLGIGQPVIQQVDQAPQATQMEQKEKARSTFAI